MNQPEKAIAHSGLQELNEPDLSTAFEAGPVVARFLIRCDETLSARLALGDYIWVS